MWYKSQERPFSVMNKGAAETSSLRAVPRCVGTFVAVLMALLKLNAESFQTVDSNNSSWRLLKEKMLNFSASDSTVIQNNSPSIPFSGLDLIQMLIRHDVPILLKDFLIT